MAQRAQKSDQKMSSFADPDTEAARIASMEKKARIYRMVKNGEHVPKHLRDELLVEMDREGDSDDSRSRSSRSRSRSRSWSRSRSRSRSRDRNNWDRDESAQLARDSSRVAVGGCSHLSQA